MTTPSPYRGYWLSVLPDNRTQIRVAGDPDVVCTEADIRTAMATIDEWIANRNDT